MFLRGAMLLYAGCGIPTLASGDYRLLRHPAGTPHRQKEYRLAQGTIARVTDRGFGFIQLERGEDLFFHSSALQNVSFDEIRRGDVVEFDMEADTRGRGNRAVNVRKIDR